MQPKPNDVAFVVFFQKMAEKRRPLKCTSDHKTKYFLQNGRAHSCLDKRTRLVKGAGSDTQATSRGTTVQSFQNLQKFWRARSRLYQNEILQENMRSTAFLQVLQDVHTFAPLETQNFSKKSVQSFSNFVKNSAKCCKCCKICKILNLQKNSKCRLDNLI